MIDLADSGRSIIAWLQAAFLRITDHLCPAGFRVTGKNTVTMLRHFLRQQCGVDPAHHHPHITGPVFRRNLISAAGGKRFDRNSDQIRRFIIRNGFHPIIIQHHFHIRWRQTGENTEHQRLHPPLIHIQTVLLTADIRFNQYQFHSFSPGRFPCLRAISRCEAIL